MELNITKNKTQDKSINKEMYNFMEELKNSLQKATTENTLDIPEQYKEYWNIRNDMYDDVCAILGLSRLLSDNLEYYDSNDYIENQLIKLSKEEPIYRKNSLSYNSGGKLFYSIDKYENGKVEQIQIPKEKIPKEFEHGDILFQMDSKDNIQIRDDIKAKVIAGACKDMEPIKQKYDKEKESYKKEGYLYKVYEGEGYVHLRDITEDKGAIEDIDFVVNEYGGEGMYKLTNGKYKQLDWDNRYSKYWKDKTKLEHYVAEKAGLSKLSVNKKFAKEINTEIVEGLLELAENEGTIYKINGEKVNSNNEKIYDVEKFENGKVTHLELSQNKIPTKNKDKNIIFTYGENENLISREDLLEEAIENIAENLEYIKTKQDQKALSFRKEGEIYDVSEKDGYIMITNKDGKSTEDIEFVVDEYKGQGKYQVINGLYKKI